MKKVLLSLLLLYAVLLSACQSQGSAAVTETQTEVSSDEDSLADSSAMFSDRDFEVGYDENESAVILLEGDSASCSSAAVTISGSTVTITEEGTYILSGTLDDGMIIVNTDKSDKVQLVLDGVSIHSETCSPIYILQSDKVFITLAADTVSTLSNGGSFTPIDENNIDAVIYSKEDLTLNGTGALVITSPGGHGIVSKDSLKFTSGSYDINCASHAITGKDEICIANTDFSIVAGKDGIHAENADDDTLGYLYIQSGVFNISAQGDGISASSYVQIDDGSFTVTAGGGSENASMQSSDSFGNFMGGGRHDEGMPGRSNGNKSMKGGAFEGNKEAPTLENTAADSEDSSDSSMKGIKAGIALIINGGSFTVDSADDAFHSNDSITVNGGTFTIASGDDAFHADQTLTVTDGVINITESYEGLEGLYVNIFGGEITIVSSDDGLNAAGGADESGAGGRDGMFGSGGFSSSQGALTISGGVITITASGDGLDANGTLEITGGTITVSGPANGDTSTLDYDTSATISGGTFIGTGASGMSQSFSDSDQGVIFVRLNTQSANTLITLTDSSGNTLISHTAALDFSVIILSSPDIKSGESYTLTVGADSQTVTAS